jgi:hypothetical protein
MKNLFLSVVLTVICCTAFSQTKKTDSSRKNVDTRAVQSQQLVQQKIWPLKNMPAKNNDAVIINPHPLLKTWVRL